MGRLDGKVALITGAARGQGRSHAVRLAAEGANIVALDICEPISTVPYPMPAEEDLAETGRIVEKAGAKVMTRKADVRHLSQLESVVADAVIEFGGIDIVSVNAGIFGTGVAWELPPQAWHDVINVNLTGVWHTVRAVIPHMIERGQGGSIVVTSSAAGVQGVPNLVHYVAAKHGVVGVMRTLANELGQHSIRVNVIAPTTVSTDMVHNPSLYRLFCPDIENPTREDAAAALRPMNLLPIPWVEPVDISNALLWLASDESRYVTGSVFPVDAGWTARA